MERSPTKKRGIFDGDSTKSGSGSRQKRKEDSKSILKRSFGSGDLASSNTRPGSGGRSDGSFSEWNSQTPDRTSDMSSATRQVEDHVSSTKSAIASALNVKTGSKISKPI